MAAAPGGCPASPLPPATSAAGSPDREPLGAAASPNSAEAAAPGLAETGLWGCPAGWSGRSAPPAAAAAAGCCAGAASEGAAVTGLGADGGSSALDPGRLVGRSEVKSRCAAAPPATGGRPEAPGGGSEGSSAALSAAATASETFCCACLASKPPTVPAAAGAGAGAAPSAPGGASSGYTNVTGTAVAAPPVLPEATAEPVTWRDCCCR